MNKGNVVPVLITGDVDFSQHHRCDDKENAFDQIIRGCENLSVPITCFFVANEAKQVPDYPGQLVEAGHEIGCHGLTHGSEEEYSSMPSKVQYEYLESATEILKGISGIPISSFRAPRVKISPTTYVILSKLGYIADSSVCSQRFDLISSNLLHTGWLTAPRLPYYPSEESAYRRGELDVLVIPISAIAAPFISSALYALGLSFMKALFRLLYLESRRTGKPVVYLFHPYEFAPEIPGAKNYDRNVGVHGFRFRRHLYRGDSQDRLDWNLKLWAYMKSFDAVEFMTMKQYCENYQRGQLLSAA